MRTVLLLERHLSANHVRKLAGLALGVVLDLPLRVRLYSPTPRRLQCRRQGNGKEVSMQEHDKYRVLLAWEHEGSGEFAARFALIAHHFANPDLVALLQWPRRVETQRGQDQLVGEGEKRREEGKRKEERPWR